MIWQHSWTTNLKYNGLHAVTAPTHMFSDMILKP